MPELAIVIPVYNEAANVGELLREWREAFENLSINCCFIFLNDGSTDDTAARLDAFTTVPLSRIDIVHKANSGHGRTCRLGYQRALATDSAIRSTSPTCGRRAKRPTAFLACG